MFSYPKTNQDQEVLSVFNLRLFFLLHQKFLMSECVLLYEYATIISLASLQMLGLICKTSLPHCIGYLAFFEDRNT